MLRFLRFLKEREGSRKETGNGGNLTARGVLGDAERKSGLRERGGILYSYEDGSSVGRILKEVIVKMAEETKKAKTASKPRKTTSKKAAADPLIAGQVTDNNHSVPHEEVAKLAHHYYRERGHKHGHHMDDWFRAEQELRGRAS